MYPNRSRTTKGADELPSRDPAWVWQQTELSLGVVGQAFDEGSASFVLCFGNTETGHVAYTPSC